MQFESFKREEPRINVSALIDVVFILLIFVVLAANFDRIREMNVVLPSAEQTNPRSQDSLVLTIPVEGELLLGEEPVSEEDLDGALRRHREDFEVLLLVSDGRVELERVVGIFDKASAAGFQSVSIATRSGGQ